MMPLDRNESYWLLDDELTAAVSAPKTDELSTYPDYGELKSALATYAGVASENILVTPGSVTAIEYIARAYTAGCEGQTFTREAILPVPTFYCYESILDSVGAKVIPISYEEQGGHFIFPLAKTIEALKSGTAKILFICHPNNPLGNSLSKEEITALVDAAHGSDTLIVSDEAYFEFSSGTTFLPYLAELPNLIIIRTLSKAFALSGTRIGYVIAAPQIVKKIEKVILPWPVAHQSVTAALTLLAQAKKVKVRREAVITEREHFIKELNKIPDITVYPSETNFVLVRVPDAKKVRDTLLTQDIRIVLGEPMSHVPEAQVLLKDTLRIVVPAPESRDFFIAAFREALH